MIQPIQEVSEIDGGMFATGSLHLDLPIVRIEPEIDCLEVSFTVLDADGLTPSFIKFDMSARTLQIPN